MKLLHDLWIEIPSGVRKSYWRIIRKGTDIRIIPNHGSEPWRNIEAADGSFLGRSYAYDIRTEKEAEGMIFNTVSNPSREDTK